MTKKVYLFILRMDKYINVLFLEIDRIELTGFCTFRYTIYDLNRIKTTKMKGL